MTYPSPSVAPSVYTAFVNGIKLDICEVIPAAYDMLLSKQYRFFLCVEDDFICKYKYAQKLFDKTGEDRWDMFCMTKSECMDLILKFNGHYEKIVLIEQQSIDKPVFKKSNDIIIKKIKDQCIDFYSKSPFCSNN